MRLRSIRVAAIHELPLQCVFLHQSYKAHLQTEMVLRKLYEPLAFLARQLLPFGNAKGEQVGRAAQRTGSSWR